MRNAVVLLLDIMHQQSEKIGDLIKRLIVKCGEVLSLVALPVLFILVALVKKVTLLFHLIMVYVEGTIVDVELSILDLTGGIRGLEANESEWALVILLSEKFK